jgi:hypothetical protein
MRLPRAEVTAMKLDECQTADSAGGGTADRRPSSDADRRRRYFARRRRSNTTFLVIMLPTRNNSGICFIALRRAGTSSNRELRSRYAKSRSPSKNCVLTQHRPTRGVSSRSGLNSNRKQLVEGHFASIGFVLLDFTRQRDPLARRQVSALSPN